MSQDNIRKSYGKILSMIAASFVIGMGLCFGLASQVQSRNAFDDARAEMEKHREALSQDYERARKAMSSTFADDGDTSSERHADKDKKIYHNSNCKEYNSPSCSLVFKTREAGRKAGFMPCELCGG